MLDDAGAERAIVAGISGGATIALALALSRPERIAIAVAHEPAVGSLSPELRAVVQGALDRGGGLELLRVLAGRETWGKLPGCARRDARGDPGARRGRRGRVPRIRAAAVARPAPCPAAVLRGRALKRAAVHGGAAARGADGGADRRRPRLWPPSPAGRSRSVRHADIGPSSCTRRQDWSAMTTMTPATSRRSGSVSVALDRTDRPRAHRARANRLAA